MSAHLPRVLFFRIALVAAAAAYLWRRPPVGLLELLQTPSVSDEAQRLGVLLLAACAAGVLTFSYTERPNVHLLLVPAAVTAWQVGPEVAVALAAFGAALGNALRRAAALVAVSGAARTALALAAGFAAGDVARNWVKPGYVTAPTGDGLSLDAAWLAAAVAMALVTSLADWLLDWLDGRLDPARVADGEPLEETRSAAFIDTTPLAPVGPQALRDSRMDPLTNVLVLPLALFFQIVYVAVGFQSMAVLLLGLLALLLVVRTFINLRTLHESLERASARLAEQREKLVTLFGQSGEGIYTVDADLRVGTINGAMARLLEVEPPEIEGQECAAVCRFEDTQGHALCPDRCPLRQAHSEHQPVTLEVLHPLLDQPPRHLLLTYTAVSDATGKLGLGIGIARDMSAQKEAEKLRDEFVSLVTHELRSPLTVSIGYIDLLKRALLREEGETLPRERQVYFVNRIEGAERHLLRLVNNLLEMARVERPDLKLELGEVSVDGLLREVVDGAATVAAEKNQTVQVDIPPAVPVLWSSELYLREVFSNLLSNAVKYTPEGGLVTVTLRVLEGAAGAERLEVVVADTGYGMSEEDLGRLFGKFFRSGRQEIRKERGTGLGLALTKQMIEKLDGTISVQSELGKGSTFTVSIPITTPPPEAERALEERPQPLVAA